MLSAAREGGYRRLCGSSRGQSGSRTVSDRDRIGWEPLAAVQVPKGILWLALIAIRIRQRKTSQAIERFSQATDTLGTLLGTRMRETDERQQQLLDLQVSVEKLTRWLVALTIVVALGGIASIAVALVVAIT